MTPDLKTLEGLLAKVEAATGPDREIDFAIARWEGWTERTDEDDPVFVGKVSTWWAEPGCAYFSTCSHPDHVTKSLDAALALIERVLPGWVWQLYSAGGGIPAGAGVFFPNDSKRYASADGAAPALALLAALLRAKIEDARHAG